MSRASLSPHRRPEPASSPLAFRALSLALQRLGPLPGCPGFRLGGIERRTLSSPAIRTLTSAYDRLRAAKRSLVIGKSFQRQLHPEGGVGPAARPGRDLRPSYDWPSVCGTKTVRDKLGISKGCCCRAIGVHQEPAGEVSPFIDQSMRQAHAGPYPPPGIGSLRSKSSPPGTSDGEPQAFTGGLGCRQWDGRHSGSGVTT